MNRRAARKARNGVFLALSVARDLVGLACLAAILWTLISHGIAGMSSRVFTQMTPPPGRGRPAQRALRQRRHDAARDLIGSPIGMLAGTYLAEYGRTRA
jgi:phosphate transport system permease protein